MIQNYSDPIVTLNQVYKQVGTGTTALLGACVIGPHYFVRLYEDLKEALRLDDLTHTYTPTGGLTAREYPATDADDIKINTNTVNIFVKDALLQLAKYISGVAVSNDTVTITEGSVAVEFDKKGIKAGDTVTLVQLDVSLALVTSVYKLEQDANKKYTKCVLAANVDETKTITSITFSRVADCQVSQEYIDTATANKVGIKLNAKSDLIDLGNGNAQYSILKGSFYVEYSAMSKRYCNKYGMLAYVDDVLLTLGKICDLNPLGMAVANALALSNGNFVYFVAVDKTDDDTLSDLVAAYNQAADLIADKDGIYGIVPCTANAAVLKALLAFVNSQSSLKIPYFKYLYGSVDILDFKKLTEKALTADSDYDDTTKLTKLTLALGALLKIDRIVEGDKVVNISNKHEAFVKKVQGNNLIFVEGLHSSYFKSSNTIAVYHNLKDKKSEIIEYIILNKPIADKRAMLAFADGATYNGYTIKNYCVAAALAGKRSGTYPHAPLSNVTMAAITTSELHGFTASQSKQLGANGFWRVGLNELGVCISRRQLTSAAANDVNYDLQSIVCDIDSIGLSLKTTGRNLVGSSNISASLLLILETTLLLKLASFQIAKDRLIGPQLLSAQLLSIEQDPVNKDKIYASMSGEPPKPFNLFHMTFYMN